MTNQPPTFGQPPGPPPYSLPGNPAQPGYPAQPYGTPPAKKSRKWLWIILGIVGVLVVIVIAAIALVFNSVSKNTLAVGDCLYFSSVSETPADTSHEKRGCDDATATYEVGIASDGTATCDSDYFTYSLLSGDKTVQTLCLLPNLKTGSCYTPEDDGRFLPSACTDPKAVKITNRVDGSADESLCGGSDYPEVYRTPPRTYCVGPAES